ncbi:uncharacterized protein LOC119402866 isoform X1 [Rhipicephalus sanguineus]|uniref:uncharacterized protein LOC119402866 isoform X1 n=1 Tax=Rhipicephalus sanguineus TaxID=34632 RepID=UPI00189390EA|nr:uncharacterized protein LOC119402866 isoform X1 [Rhipicephalus sanguineus]
MQVFRRDILFIMTMFFLLSPFAQQPICVLAGQILSRRVVGQHPSVPPRGSEQHGVPGIPSRPPSPLLGPKRRPPVVQVPWRRPSPLVSKRWKSGYHPGRPRPRPRFVGRSPGPW